MGEAITELQLRSRDAVETEAQAGLGAGGVEGWGVGAREVGGSGGRPQAPNAARHDSVRAQQRGSINLFISL